MMTKILVGSENPVKLISVETAFTKYFDDVKVTGYSVDSKVADQPVNNETFEGAKNRALGLKILNEEQNINGDYFVGIEGGIIELYSKWFAFGCMCIIDKNDRSGFGTSPYFELPEFMIKELLDGKELGHLMDKLQNESNTKQKHGAIGYFTNGIMSRSELYVPGLITALIPFLHPNLFT